MPERNRAPNSLPHEPPDVPRELCMTHLRDVRRPGQQQSAENFSKRLRTQRPNLYVYIAATALEIAPDDAELRGKIAAGLGRIVQLFDTLELHDQLEKMWNLDPGPEEEMPATAGGEMHGGGEAAPPVA